MKNSSVRIRPSKLFGNVVLSGAKNSVLKLQAASILTSDTIFIENAPVGITDFNIHNEMLVALGKNTNIQGTSLTINEPQQLQTDLNWAGDSIRNTLLILGTLLARFHKGKVPLPGGCKLGDRKFDLHIMAMEKLGARIWEHESGDYLCAESNGRLKGSDIFLPIRSTGATENAILMGVLAEGRTRVWNPHVRPEILDLIFLLQKMGAQIEVRGQESIIVDGVDALGGASHRVIPDNMEALTFLVACAITGGEVEIADFPFGDLEIPLIHLSSSGLKYYRSNCGKDLIVHNSRVYPFDVATGPYPGINSDMQPIFAALGVVARGESHIADLRFFGRFKYAEELQKLGADISTKGSTLTIRGGVPLIGTTISATDLRGGAAAMLCGLVAKGETVVTNFGQVLRGYDNIVKKLQDLEVGIKVL